MAKFTDIALLGEGRQLKEYIEGKYTIEEIAKKFNLSLDSALRYFKDGQITNDKFKLQMEELFQDKFENMIQTPIADQINEIILSIKANIIHYNDKEDSKVINKALKYAKLYSDQYHQLMAHGNLAIYRYNIGLEYESKELLKEVIRSCVKNKFDDMAVFLSLQLSFCYLYHDNTTALKILDNIKHLVKEDLTAYTLFNYYFFNGVLMYEKNKCKEARKYLEKSCQYALQTDQKARAYFNIGLNYQKEKSYKLALEWNNKAYDLSPSKEIKIAILNNIANVYLVRNKLDRAMWFAERAIELFDDKINNNRKICVYDTYLDINPNKAIKLLDDVMELLKESTSFTDNLDLVKFIDKVFTIHKGERDFLSINRILKNLFVFCEIEAERLVLKELKALVLDIIIYLKREGELDYGEIF